MEHINTLDLKHGGNGDILGMINIGLTPSQCLPLSVCSFRSSKTPTKQ